MHVIYTAVLEDSEPDLRACVRGVTDSSNISRALSPEPTVKANKPTSTSYKIKNCGRNDSAKLANNHKTALEDAPMRWHAKRISVADPFLKEFRH